MYGYGYGYRDPSGGFAALIIFLIIAEIAALVCTIIGYRKFVSNQDVPAFKINDVNTWGPFSRFDKLIVGNVLRWFYLFSALSLGFGGVVFTLYCIFGLADTGIPEALCFVIALLNLVGVCLGELLVRVGYEERLLRVIIAEKSSDITELLRKHFDDYDTHGNVSADAGDAPDPTAPVMPGAGNFFSGPARRVGNAFNAEPPAASAGSAYRPQSPTPPAPSAPRYQAPTAPTAPTAPASHVSPASVPPVVPPSTQAPSAPKHQAPQAGTWTCPICGTENNGNFCRSCGNKRPQ